MPYDNNNSFIISKNRKGDNPKRPDYRGEITIDGRTYELAGWIREKKSDGSKFISGTVKPKEQRQPAEPRRDPAPTPTPTKAEDIEEDVPF